MNIETGELKPFGDLTDEQKASGQWVEATPDAMAAFKAKQAAIAMREHNRQVRRESEAKAKPDLVAALVAKAEAKRARKRAAMAGGNC